MIQLLKRITCVFLSLLVLTAMLPCATAAENTEEAVDITKEAEITASEGLYFLRALTDGYHSHIPAIRNGSWIKLEHPQGFGSLYFIFHWEYVGYTITNNDTGAVHTVGEEGFLHNFVDLAAIFGSAPKSVTISFENGDAQLREIYAFTTGEVPSFVQRWSAPVDGKTDLVLFSTHGDDDQLFFAGLLPYYAGELGYQVQVCYLTNHRRSEPERIHEMLNGLWAVGVTTYPVFGEYNDFLRETMAGAYSSFAALGWPREHLMGYVVEQLRRFKPLVAVGHDVYGEYGHGQHMVYTDLLMDALEISNDPQYYPELAEKYGLWDVPKTYLHLYWENKITMDWDRPLEKFGGMTAYEVTKDLGFPCHKSQLQAFTSYFWKASKATEVYAYGPTEYGLFRSTVGEDVLKNDFFENLTTYAEQERIAEEARIAEEKRLKEEEEARLKAEAEEKARLAAEAEAKRLAEEEAAAKEKAEQRLAEEQAQALQEKRQQILILTGIGALFLAAAGVITYRKRQ